MKWPKLPTIPVLTMRQTRIIHFSAAAVLVLLAIIGNNRWISMLDTGLAGFNLAQGICTIFQERMMGHMRDMSAAFDEMLHLNGELIARRVQIIMEGGDPDEDRPSVH